MIRIFKAKNIGEFQGLNINARSEGIVYQKMDYVRNIVSQVKEKGDEAVIKFTKRFDGVDLSGEGLRVSDNEIDQAFSGVEEEYKKAVQIAIGNLEKYHQMQYPKDYVIDVRNGVELGRRWSPIETVGLYVPGGLAPYVTVCYMLGTPARVAGCKNRIICVPPDKNTGKVNPYVLASARLAGITEVYKIGGAQAIAAMAYGTKSVPKVGKIFGPGNVYVTAAKLLVYGNVDIDAPAGPSEALIIADETANYKFVASDILSQAEHDIDAAAILLTTSENFAETVKEEISHQVEALPKRDIAKGSLAKCGAIVILPDIDTCIEIANSYAPEHIQIMTKDSELDAKKIVNSGSVFIGDFTPIAAGDYMSGTNNVIPTGGASKMFSPVHVEGFMKCQQTQRITKEGLCSLAEYIKTVSEIEGFDAHYESVKIRL